MMIQTIKEAVEAATVRFPTRGGQGVLVPGGLIVTAAHVINWQHEEMTLDNIKFVQVIETAGRRLMVYPLAVEPVADLAVLGALDNQWNPEAAAEFEQFCAATHPIPLATAEFAFDEPVPAHVLAHTGRWISGCVRQMAPDAHTLVLEPDEQIEPGTSGSPVVTDDGLLLGVVSMDMESSMIPRPHLTAPVWLAPRMMAQNQEDVSSDLRDGVGIIK